MAMPETDLMRAALQLAMHAAPNGRVQTALAKLYERDRIEPDLLPADVTTRTISRVYDGLSYGNWPKD